MGYVMEEELVQEYEAFYRDHPGLWEADDSRCCQTVARFMPAPKKILDVGCGNGHTLAALRQIFSQVALYGIDISGEALKLAKARVPVAKFFQGFIEKFSTTLRFDVVTVIGTAEHFINPVESFRQIKNLLSKSGVIYIEVPHNLLYSPGPHTYRRLESGSRQMEWHLARNEWEDLIRQAGLTIIESGRGDSPVNEFVWVLR